MFLQGWVNGILINESSVYGTLCIVLLKILNMGLYFSEIDTRGWPYRRHDLLLPFNHSFARILAIYFCYLHIHRVFTYIVYIHERKNILKSCFYQNTCWYIMDGGFIWNIG